MIYKLEIFRTYNQRGWGVRTLEFIPEGAFVNEITGKVYSSIDDDKLHEKENEEHNLDLAFLFDLLERDDDDKK